MWKGVEQDKSLTAFQYFQWQLWAWAQPCNCAWSGCCTGGWDGWNTWSSVMLWELLKVCEPRDFIPNWGESQNLPSVMLLGSLLPQNRKVISSFSGHFIYLIYLTRNCCVLKYNICQVFQFSLIRCASSKTEVEKGDYFSSLTVHVSAVLWLHKNSIETKTPVSGIFPHLGKSSVDH